MTFLLYCITLLLIFTNSFMLAITYETLLAVMNGVSFILYGLGFYWYCTDGSLLIMLFGLFISACTSLMMVCLNHIGAIDEYKDESRQATYILKRKTIKF